MMYTVIKDFTDLKDKNHVYRAGEQYPRTGVNASAERVAELASADNKRGEALIKAVGGSRTAVISAESNEKRESEQVDVKPKKNRRKQNKKEN